MISERMPALRFRAGFFASDLPVNEPIESDSELEPGDRALRVEAVAVKGNKSLIQCYSSIASPRLGY